MAYIYGLIDPAINELKYVGYSEEDDPKIRRNGHWKERNFSKRTHKRNWLRALYESYNIKPEIFIIEEIEPEQWTEAETFWIEYFRFLGCNLTNEALGSRGKIKGTKLTEKHKRKISLGCSGKKYPNRKSPEGGVWNQGIKMDYFPNGGKVAKGVERPWQDGEARSEHRRKEYIFVNPSGKIHKVKGLRKFCREMNLNPSNMAQVAKGKLGQYKGWTTFNG